MATPTMAQAYSASAAAGTAISEYPTIKGIFAADSAQMHVSSTTALHSIDTITV